MKIGCLTEDDLKCYRDNQIIICGFRGWSQTLYKILKKNNLNVVGFYLQKDRPYIIELVLKIFLKIKYDGATIFNEKQMEEIHKLYGKPVMIELPGAETAKRVSDSQRNITVLSGSQFKTSFDDKYYIDRLKNIFYRLNEEYRWNRERVNPDRKVYREFLEKNYNNPIYICLPPKTADHTLNHTFNDLGEDLHYYNSKHKPIFIEQVKNNERIRIITAVREPISQNLSFFYQEVATGAIYKHMIMGKLENSNNKEKVISLQIQEKKFSQCKDNTKEFFEYFLQHFYPIEGFLNRSWDVGLIQEFIGEFDKHILNLLKYPFDKEKGYTIIKEGNIEIFVYQLEKLNDIVPELSKWVGVSFDKLENGNQASDKWVGPSYKQALKEIEISQKYFDRCYDEPYVKHFYSETDIEKFKERWRSHIKM